MLAGLVARLARQSPDSPAIVGADGRASTYADIAAESSLPDLGPPGEPIAIHRLEDDLFVRALVRADAEGRSVLLLDPDWPEPEARGKAQETGFPWFWGWGKGAERLPAQGSRLKLAGSRLLLLTSGTSGPPKVAVHGWSTLAEGLSAGEHVGGRWLLTYRLSQFAGIQVFLQAFAARGTLVIPGSRVPGDLVSTIAEHRINYVSGTSSFWIRLLIANPEEKLRALPLEHITLGGEVVPGPLLARLKAIWPAARIHQIYASTELGVLVRVRDGLPGFPAAFLERDAERLQIRGGELWARPSGRMLGYLGQAPEPDGWVPTGDLAEIQGDRVVFLGRRTDVINVGGAKAVPSMIEAFLLGVPGVLAARVFGRSSSVTGQIVAAEIVLEPGIAPEDGEARVRSACAAHLPPHQAPRLIQFVDSIAVTRAQKALRRAED